MQNATIAIWTDRKAAERRWRFGLNVFESYAAEVLEHAGISYSSIQDGSELITHKPDIVIAALVNDDASTKEILKQYMDSGGTVISFAGMNEFAAIAGCTPHRVVENGYANVTYRNEKLLLRFIHAVTWAKQEDQPAADTSSGELFCGQPGGQSAGPLIQSFAVGKGRLIHWAVDLWGTIVKMQQGQAPVIRDGLPAPDGSAHVDDGILKADDQIAFHWDYDRQMTDSGIPYFHLPQADLWKELFVHQLISSVLETGKTLSFIGYWPDGIDQVATISHDSDHNQDAHAEVTLDLLKECDLKTTWCIIEPGYGEAVYLKVKEAGHELAFHYNALDADGGRWAESEFKRQFDWLLEACDEKTIVSNKNHYTRFEGFGELFEWCEKYGISSDQTRGPSKKGNVGFLFGTCHPYFPIAWATERNRMYNVLEISFLTQDLELGHLADNQVIEPFLDGVKKVNGVAHFLYHQIHIHNKESVRDSIRYLAATARSKGFVFWTASQINDWERYRRAMIIPGSDKASDVSSQKVEDANLRAVRWTPVHAGETADSIMFGISCKKTVLASDKN